MGGRAELVFIPCPFMGHIVSTVEAAKRLVDRDEGLSAAVLLMKLSNNTSMKAIIDSVSASSSTNRIRFIELPEPDSQDASPTGSSAFENLLRSIEGYKPHIRGTVLRLSGSNLGFDSPRLAGFVIDMLCVSMIDVADELGVPSYVFYTSGAAFLGIMFHLQAMEDDKNQQDIRKLIESDATIEYPSFANPLPAKLLPIELLRKDVSSLFLGLTKRFREAKGIMVNTFEELEPRVIESAFDNKVLPLYAVGPILNLKSRIEDVSSCDILKWLDDQPLASVVFLCFGSMGSFQEEQVRQVASALERSGHRFLWSLRRRPAPGTLDSPSNYENPEEILLEGFLDRTAGKGKVIGWAPQAQVLAHPAIGGFVSHCGWSSILESIWFGVPVAAWPMYAEQHFNAFVLVDDLCMAVEIRMDYRRDFVTGNEVVVSAEEIERGIRRLMETESGERENAKLMREKSRRALMEGGSSHLNLGRFIKNVYDSVP